MARYGGSINDSVSPSVDYRGEDAAECRTVSSKEQIRSKLNDDVEEFLKQGGAIEQVSTGVTNDPPRKPQSNYGRRPI